MQLHVYIWIRNTLMYASVNNNCIFGIRASVCALDFSAWDAHSSLVSANQCCAYWVNFCTCSENNCISIRRLRNSPTRCSVFVLYRSLEAIWWSIWGYKRNIWIFESGLEGDLEKKKNTQKPSILECLTQWPLWPHPLTLYVLVLWCSPLVSNWAMPQWRN